MDVVSIISRKAAARNFLSTSTMCSTGAHLHFSTRFWDFLEDLGVLCFVVLLSLGFRYIMSNKISWLNLMASVSLMRNINYFGACIWQVSHVFWIYLRVSIVYAAGVSCRREWQGQRLQCWILFACPHKIMLAFSVWCAIKDSLINAYLEVFEYHHRYWLEWLACMLSVSSLCAVILVNTPLAVQISWYCIRAQCISPISRLIYLASPVGVNCCQLYCQQYYEL